MKQLRTVLLVLTVAVLAGCSASVSVHPVAPPAPNTVRTVDGIPFRVPAHYTIRVYRYVESKEAYETVEHYVRSLPNPDELYAINFSAKALSDQKVNLKFRNDGTLTEMNLSGAVQKVDEAITAFGTQAVNAFSAFQNRELTALEAAKKDAEARKALAEAEAALATAADKPTVAQDDALVAALTALNAARDAEAALNALAAEATPAERVAAENALRLARLRANIAFRRAGLDPPFIDVFP